MKNVVRKAVFPVAGFGTRFLPATKANPKEMLPIVDKPLIQFAVEEAIASGITELIFVTNSSKRAIEDHFDSNFELEYMLEKKGQRSLLQQVQNIVPSGVTCIYVRQSQALGLGHAVMCAREVIGDEPFAVILADDLIEGFGKPCLAQMLSIYDESQSNIIAVERIPRSESDKYGIVSVAPNFERAGAISAIVEKPHPDDAPSEFGVVGRYILNAEIFEVLEHLAPGANGEIQLTDAISELLFSQTTMALEFSGTRFDCGSKFGYLQAVVDYGLRHAALGQRFAQHLASVVEHLAVDVED